VLVRAGGLRLFRPAGSLLCRLAVPVLAALLTCGQVSASAQMRNTAAQKKVLVLHLMRRDEASAANNERIYRRVLTDALPGQIDYYSEYVDLARFGREDYPVAFRDFLKEKYTGTNFDLIIGITGPKDFLTQYGPEVFPNAPVVFSMSADKYEKSATPPNFTGIVYEIDLRGTLDIIHRLQPGVRHVIVVTGASQAVDKSHEARARRQFGTYAGGVDFTYWSGLPMDELKRRVSALTPECAVYFVMMTEDGAGRRFALSEAIDELAAASSVPIYTWHDSYLGHGVIGGKLTSSELVARRTAELALRVLRGERVESIPVADVNTSRMAFDWRQLRRWKLDEGKLPAGSEILFREATFWQRYSSRIITMIALSMLQSALIVALLLERQRRRKAAIGLKQLEQQVVRSEREFSTLVENSPDVICRLDRDLRYIYVSPNLKGIFRISADVFLGKRPGEVPVPNYDSKTFEDRCREAVERRQPTVHEFQFEEHQYRTRIVPEYSAGGEVESVMSITEDFTVRLRAELELRKLTARLLNLQDDERRRIARELHDGTAQSISAISLNLSRLERVNINATSEMTRLLRDSQDLAEQSVAELRTLSYLLHPPILDHAGLVRALQLFVRGFSERTGINVDVAGVQDIGRLPADVETALFRIVQESLTNVRRHSGSNSAGIRLEKRDAEIKLQVSDRGHGMLQGLGDNELGVGISGMRQRLSQLGGRLEIESNSGGTTITVRIPTGHGSAFSQHSGG
jgi:PAS domain S-box-containing protein